MKKSRISLLVGIGVVIVLTVIGLMSQKDITLKLEGQDLLISTRAWQVEGALKSAGIELQAEDLVVPGPNTFLKDGMVIELSRAVSVVLNIGDQISEIKTPSRTPAEWIVAAGFSMGDHDRILINGQRTPADQTMLYQEEYLLELQPAIPIIVQTEGAQWEISSAALTLGEALWEAGFLLLESDQLSPPPETLLTESTTVQLTPGRKISVLFGESKVDVYTSASTVGAALAQAGLALQGMDYSVPSEEQALPEDGQIRVVRVTEEVVINQETIPYDYELQPDGELELDQFRILQAGQVGLRAERFRVRYEDGVEVSRQKEDGWLVREPVTRIQGYGTKIVVRTLDTPDGPVEYWRAVEMLATSYSPCRSDGEPGRCYPGTSLGLPVQKGVAAVIYEWYIPMGWHTVYVPDYGHAVIADVGGGIPGEYWIDLGYSDDDYVSWYRRTMVYFTLPIPPEHEIVYFLTTK
jgi:uncharacterized protein YabE (DUF348 family)